MRVICAFSDSYIDAVSNTVRSELMQHNPTVLFSKFHYCKGHLCSETDEQLIEPLLYYYYLEWIKKRFQTPEYTKGHLFQEIQ